MLGLFELWRKRYGNLPSSYMVWDTETNMKTDHVDCKIVEIGLMEVRDDIPQKPISMLVKRPPGTMPDPNDPNAKNVSGITDEMLADGIPPEEVFGEIADHFEWYAGKGNPFVGHNIVKFDYPRFQNELGEATGRLFSLHPDSMLDTGAMVKGLQMPEGLGHLQHGDDTILEWCLRVLRSRNKVTRRIKWSLDGYCLGEYNLVAKYNLKPASTHRVGYDCYATHCLFQELKKI